MQAGGAVHWPSVHTWPAAQSRSAAPGPAVGERDTQVVAVLRASARFDPQQQAAVGGRLEADGLVVVGGPGLDQAAAVGVEQRQVEVAVGVAEERLQRQQASAADLDGVPVGVAADGQVFVEARGQRGRGGGGVVLLEVVVDAHQAVAALDRDLERVGVLGVAEAVDAIRAASATSASNTSSSSSSDEVAGSSSSPRASCSARSTSPSAWRNRAATVSVPPSQTSTAYQSSSPAQTCRRARSPSSGVAANGASLGSKRSSTQTARSTQAPSAQVWPGGTVAVVGAAAVGQVDQQVVAVLGAAEALDAQEQRPVLRGQVAQRLVVVGRARLGQAPAVGVEERQSRSPSACRKAASTLSTPSPQTSMAYQSASPQTARPS